MKKPMRNVLLICALVFILGGCATHNAQEVGPTSILQAQVEIPEEELLDVGITVFETQELTEEDLVSKVTIPRMNGSTWTSG